MSNQFLPFCPTDTGTNLLSQSEYLAAADRTDGNQPGVASSKLNNKALRQATYIASQLAQFVANKTGADVLDDGVSARLLAQLNAAMVPIAPRVTPILTGSGNHNYTFIFFIASGNATVGATYTNNAITYTVKATVASAVQVAMSGNGSPTVSGVLTKTGGVGDATLTFYAMRAPVYAKIRAVAGGGGGGGNGTSGGGAGGDGGDTTFGAYSALKGVGGTAGSSSASASPTTGGLTSGSPDVSVPGGDGDIGVLSTSGSPSSLEPGGYGGCTFFGGVGKNSTAAAGAAGKTNTGAGGGGASGTNGAFPGGGGSGGGYLEVTLANPAAAVAYAVGAGGTAGGAGVAGHTGGVGAEGALYIEENYQ